MTTGPRACCTVLGLALTLASCTADRPVIEDGASVDVLFDERHGLSGGERVVFHDFDIGEVTAVDVHQARVRARLTIERRVVEQLTEATTFTVDEDSRGVYLETHVLDTEAAALTPGATLEGSDSGVELTLRRAGASASKIFELDPDDEKELERRLEQARERLGELAEASSERAREAADEIERGVERLSEELEEAGKSEQAQELREKLLELLEQVKERTQP